MRVWYGLIRTLAQLPGVPVRKLMAVVALWILPLLIVAPLFSRDVYSYVAQGEMMSHHISPYHYGPSVLGAAPSVSLVDPLWVNTPTPYGPLFMGIDGALTSLSLHHELLNVILLRLLAIGGVVLMAFGLVSLARSYGRDPSYVLTLAILNPVTLLYLVGGPTTTPSCSGFWWPASRWPVEGDRSPASSSALWPPPSRCRPPSASSTSDGRGWGRGPSPDPGPSGAHGRLDRGRRHGSSCPSSPGWVGAGC